MKKTIFNYIVLGYFFLICIGFVIYGIMSEQIYRLNVGNLIISILAYILVIFIRSQKLKKIITIYTKVPHIIIIPLTSVCQLVGAIIPARAGEILLSTYLKLKYTLDISKTLPTLLIDKIMELFFMIIYIGVGVIFFNRVNINNIFEQYTSQFIVISILILLFIIFFIIIFKSKFAKTSIVKNIYMGISLPIKYPVVGVTLLLGSGLVMLTEYYFLFNIFKAFNISISFIEIVIVHSIGFIVGVISMIPGGHGSTELSMLTVLITWGYSVDTIVLPILASKIIAYSLLAIVSIPILNDIIPIIKNVIFKKDSKKRLEES